MIPVFVILDHMIAKSKTIVLSEEDDRGLEKETKNTGKSTERKRVDY